MIDFSGVFEIIFNIFLAILVLYIVFVVVMALMKKKHIFALVLLGVLIVPILTYITTYVYFSIEISMADSSMKKVSAEYLYDKYSFEKDDYRIRSVYSSSIYFEKDGEEYRVDHIFETNLNKENLKDNYQTDVIEDTLNQYVSDLLGYKTELGTNLDAENYKLNERFDDDIAEFIRKSDKLNYLEIFIYTDRDNVGEAKAKVEETKDVLHKNLQIEPYFYICTKTKSMQTVGDELNRGFDGYYINYSYSPWEESWSKMPKTEPMYE